MSLLEVNKITPQSGTTLTLGDTGDTINFGSGVLPNFENLTVTGDLTVDTNSLKVDSTNNYVGIGTTSPAYALDVKASSSFNSAKFTGQGSSISTYIYSDSAYWSFGDTASFGGNLWGGHATNNELYAYTNGSKRMHIESNGNVGIGTSSPVGNLVVQSSAVRSANSNYRQIVAENNGNSGITILSGTTSQGGLVFGDTDSNNVGSVRYDHSANEMFFDVNGSRALTVNSSGNFGIGTSSPSGKLHIQGISGSVSGLVLQTPESSGDTNSIDFLNLNGDLRMGIEYDASTADLNIVKRDRSKIVTFDESTAYVGIGTSTPREKLQINTSGSSFLQLTNTFTGTADNNGLYVGVISGGNSYIGNRHSGNDIIFQNDNTEVMRIITGGSIGIGTSTVSGVAKVVIDGEETNNGYDVGLILKTNAANTSSPYLALGDEQAVALRGIQTGTWGRKALGFYTSDNTGTSAFDPQERMRIDSSGNVGIGTSSPSQKLHVAGSQIISSPGSSVYLYIDSTNNYIGRDSTTGDMEFGVNGSDRMRIDSSGNIFVGTGANRTSFLSQSNGNVQIENGIIFESGSSTINNEILTYRSNSLIFGTGGSEDMRIDSSGNLLVGTTQEYAYGSPGIVLHPIVTHGVTNSFTTAWSIPNNLSGLLFVQGGASGQYGGVSLFMLNKVNGFNATITQISGFAGDVAGYTSSWQLSGSNNFQLKHNIPGQTINYSLKLIAM